MYLVADEPNAREFTNVVLLRLRVAKLQDSESLTISQIDEMEQLEKELMQVWKEFHDSLSASHKKKLGGTSYIKFANIQEYSRSWRRVCV